jgi:trehalose 6-phosphate synthase
MMFPPVPHNGDNGVKTIYRVPEYGHPETEPGTAAIMECYGHPLLLEPAMRGGSTARRPPTTRTANGERRPKRRRRRRLVVVANRLPVNRVTRGGVAAWELSPGGLVTAMQPILGRSGGCWVGWSGSSGRAPRRFVYEGIDIRPVSLKEGEIEAFYRGFANRALWPLYHHAVRTPEFCRQYWEPFVEVNRRFARAAVRAAGSNDVIWVHDYHLQLVPHMVREMRPKARIGFFLHIPFPPEELFAWLPWRQWILHGLLGADLVGFQTPGDAQNFARVARRFASAEGTDSELRFRGRTVRVGAFPISIDFQAMEKLACKPDVINSAHHTRTRLGPERKLILSVDRLDYTKGICARLLAFEDLLRRKVISVDECVLVQVAVPSRETVREYAEMREMVESTVGRINGEFSQPGRVAVHYFRRNLPREELVAYYRAADVMFVTPIRDGMNLVAKEYVACRPDNSGVLVLSEFAGAARELRRALLVNPWDTEGMGTVLVNALRMPRAEGRRRMATLRMMVRRADVYAWADNFLGRLTA